MKRNSFWTKATAIIVAVMAFFGVLLVLTKEYRKAIHKTSSSLYFNNNPEILLWIIVMCGILSIGLLFWLAKMIFDREQLLTEAAMEVRKVTNTIHAGVVNYLPEGICKIVYASRGYYDIIGVDRAGLYEIYQNSLLGFILPEYHDFFLHTEELEEKGYAEKTVQMHDKDGKRYWMQVTLSKGVHGGKKAISAVFVDVSTLKRTEERLKREQERYRIVTELSNEVMFEYNFKKDVLTLSEQFTEIYGKDNIVGHFREDINTLVEMIHPEDRKSAIDMFVHTKRIGANDIQLRLRDASGEYQWCRVLYRAICDETGGPYLAIGKISNISMFKKEIEQLEHESKTDSLTGAYNKMTTKKLVDAYVREHKYETHMLLLIDVDDFKRVNDTYGHQNGDEVLMQVIKNLRENYTSGEIIGRIGGDEFVVFIGGVENKEEMVEKAQALHKLLTRPYKKGSIEIPVSASVGIALYPEAGTGYEELLYCADNALYEVKASGKGRFALYEGKKDGN